MTRRTSGYERPGGMVVGWIVVTSMVTLFLAACATDSSDDTSTAADSDRSDDGDELFGDTDDSAEPEPEADNSTGSEPEPEPQPEVEAEVDPAPEESPGDQPGDSPADEVTAMNPPTDEQRLAIEAVISQDDDTWYRCIADPPACDVEAAVAETRVVDSSAHRQYRDFVSDAVNSGTVWRVPEGRQDTTALSIQSIGVDDGGTLAIAEVCGRNNWGAFLPSAGGAMTLINGTDTDAVRRDQYGLVLQDGTWKIESREQLELVDIAIGESTCVFNG